MGEAKMPIRISDLTCHGAMTVTIQRDPEHVCIDIKIVGTDKYRTTMITVYGGDDENMPEVAMLADREPEPEEEEDEHEV